MNGYLDVGAAYCVIPRWIGERLGLDVEAGEATHLRTGMGQIQGYLHYAVLTLGDLVFDDVPIFVAKYPGFDRCLLGRAGWLQKVRETAATGVRRRLRLRNWNNKSKAFSCFLNARFQIFNFQFSI